METRTLIRARRRTPWLMCAASIVLTASTAQAAGTAGAQIGMAEPSSAPAVRALIGGELIEASAQSAVVRVGSWDGVSLSDEWAVDPQDPLTCLTDAVYYEARSESLAGQQAVAQVVINRTRSALYPNSICGVVFERTGETSGCQFSFVCDGSMYKPLEDAAWDRARLVATRAMAGFTFKPMVNATHFHATWVTPYWSSRIARIRQIGGHIFYR